jgi:hypothetical protein|tara:strand:+ start:1231 stop:1434 length:204 start_codon:yes stop_codon:yes gene_type:complete
MENIIQQIADKSIGEINHRIDRIIDMHIPIVDVIDSGINIMEGDELNELTLKVKQQILFTLIKQVTK